MFCLKDYTAFAVRRRQNGDGDRRLRGPSSPHVQCDAHSVWLLIKEIPIFLSSGNWYLTPLIHRDKRSSVGSLNKYLTVSISLTHNFCDEQNQPAARPEPFQRKMNPRSISLKNKESGGHFAS